MLSNITQLRQELIHNLADAYDIVKSKAKCRIVKGHCADKELNFHYIFEITAAPYKDEDSRSGGHVDFIGMVNNRPSGIDGGAGFFTGSPSTYTWYDKKKERYHRAASIREILYECGFNDEISVLKRKRPCVFMANLICPGLEYQGNYGKSRISNLPIFAEQIAKATVAIAKEMPTFHGYGYAASPESEETAERRILRSWTTQILSERWEAVKKDPSLKIRQKWNQSSVWYALREKILMKIGYEYTRTETATRRYVNSIINDICQKKWGVTREALGIFASERAYCISMVTSIQLNTS